VTNKSVHIHVVIMQMS